MGLNIPFVPRESSPFQWEYLSIGDIVSTHVHQKEQEDIKRSADSSYSSFYHRMKSSSFPEQYLSYKLSLQFKRTFCNLRLHADRLTFLNLYICHISYKFFPTKRCPLCNKGNDDLYHVLVACEHYKDIRPNKFADIHTSLHTHKLFRTYDTGIIKSICTDVISMLKRRRLLVGE